MLTLCALNAAGEERCERARRRFRRAHHRKTHLHLRVRSGEEQIILYVENSTGTVERLGPYQIAPHQEGGQLWTQPIRCESDMGLRALSGQLQNRRGRTPLLRLSVTSEAQGEIFFSTYRTRHQQLQSRIRSMRADTPRRVNISLAPEQRALELLFVNQRGCSQNYDLQLDERP